ncbi:MAG: flagellar basal body P-ring formation chaperone FlgA [Caulobacteraceae bacterium]
MKAFTGLIALACGLAAATASMAGAPVNLRTDIADADGRVTLGELFDNAGAASEVVVAVRAGPTAVLDAAAVQMAARRAGLDWANPQGLRRIIVRAGASDGGTSAVAGAAARNVEVLTYTRSLAAGEIVQPEDLVWAKVAVAPAGAPRDADAMIGQAARRPLRQGAAASTADVSSPQVIRAGDTINVTFASEGVTLTLQAKAVTSAAVGDAVTVKNLSSNKVIEAVASGPGTAVVGPEAALLRAARAPQLAQR